MEWMVVNPLQIHGSLASLGTQVGDSYHVNKDCFLTLTEILNKLLVEDRTLRPFRRTLGLTQVIKKDLIPLLVNCKDDFKIIDLTIRILVNLTIPVECLLSLELVSKSDAGRHIILDLNRSLMLGKEAFVDPRSSRAIVNHMKRVLEKGDDLSQEECENINSCLLLLRNVLHIPEMRTCQSSCSLQNQILWNLFTQSIDKVLIHLMTCSQKGYWGITMVQLIAIMYKDQHVGTLQKLLNLWFEASLSESSEDNESNTSPPDQGSGGESSPILTSDPTSDSSDNGCSQKTRRLSVHSEENREENNEDSDETSGVHSTRRPSISESSKSSARSSVDSSKKSQSTSSSSWKNSCKKTKREKLNDNEMLPPASYPIPMDAKDLPSTLLAHMPKSWPTDTPANAKKDCPSSSELSDYGYATQVENQESISTSSNEDESPHKRPVHQKPHSGQKIRPATKTNAGPQEKREWRRKKLVKRSKTSIMNMKALLHHTPSDEDISNLLKEFTVDFLLKGYGHLVQELHFQLLSSKQEIQVDTSHFFWLVTYFLKFATQLELDLEHISPVLSFEIVSYLTYEGVNICEQLELISRQPGTNFKPCLRQIHLVVTAIREFIQAVECYRKLTHLSKEDREHLLDLQLKIASTEDLKCLFVLLLRQYDPSLHSKQYLQDLIVTNHMLLLFLDSVGKLPEFRGENNMLEHIKQFATIEVMHRYGLLLEDFQNNGEFINDCVFTMMHHIGGDIEQVAVLFQPNILKTFSKIWETDYEVCEDWSDLIEYVIHKFVDKPKHNSLPLKLAPVISGMEDTSNFTNLAANRCDLDELQWFYLQSMKSSDPVENMQKMYAENGMENKTRIAIIEQLYSCGIINQNRYDNFMRGEVMNSVARSDIDMESDPPQIDACGILIAMSDKGNKDKSENESSSSDSDRITVLRDRLVKEKKGNLITWLQKLLMEACNAKMFVNKLLSSPKDTVLIEPVPHHYTLMNQSIPVVPWNTDQKNSLVYQPFVLLLHKLGFHLPADSGKVFVRIPNFWTPDVIFSIAQKLGPINKSLLKFDVSLIQMNYTSLDCGSDPIMISEESGSKFAVQQYTHASPVIRSIPLPNNTDNWMQLVMKSKVSAPTLPQRSPSPIPSSVSVQLSSASNNSVAEDQVSDCSVCETVAESVSSDLTRMCVSDEEDRVEVMSDTTMR